MAFPAVAADAEDEDSGLSEEEDDEEKVGACCTGTDPDCDDAETARARCAACAAANDTEADAGAFGCGDPTGFMPVDGRNDGAELGSTEVDDELDFEALHAAHLAASDGLTSVHVEHGQSTDGTVGTA